MINFIRDDGPPRYISDLYEFVEMEYSLFYKTDQRVWEYGIGYIKSKVDIQVGISVDDGNERPLNSGETVTSNRCDTPNPGEYFGSDLPE